MLKFYVANLESYNNGLCEGEWFDFETIAEYGLASLINDLGYSEFAIHDVDSEINFDAKELETADCKFIDELCKLLVSFSENDSIRFANDDDEFEILTLIANVQFSNSIWGIIETALALLKGNITTLYLGNCVANKYDALAQEYIEAGYINIPNSQDFDCLKYLDYEKMGQDFAMDGHFIVTDAGNTYFVTSQ